MGNPNLKARISSVFSLVKRWSSDGSSLTWRGHLALIELRLFLIQLYECQLSNLKQIIQNERIHSERRRSSPIGDQKIDCTWGQTTILLQSSRGSDSDQRTMPMIAMYWCWPQRNSIARAWKGNATRERLDVIPHIAPHHCSHWELYLSRPLPGSLWIPWSPS